MTKPNEETTLLNGLKPLNMTCASTDCENGLHYFRPQKRRSRKVLANTESASPSFFGTKKMDELRGADSASNHAPLIPPRGPCRACGADLVDWNRVTKRELTDVAHTFEELRKERIRHYFWHIEFDDDALARALKKGKEGLPDAVFRRIRSSVGRDTGFDGRQTPKLGNVVYYAQHATATCCRKCIEEWHAIPRGGTLTEPEVGYLSALVVRYLFERLPDLPQHGTRGKPSVAKPLLS
jgi:hypothetical protein